MHAVRDSARRSPGTDFENTADVNADRSDRLISPVKPTPSVHKSNTAFPLPGFIAVPPAPTF